MEKYLILWLTQEACEFIVDINIVTHSQLPKYLHDTIEDRYGRAGRNKIWIDKSIQNIIIDLYQYFENTTEKYKDLFKHMEKYDAGGCVFLAEHLEHARKCGGFITDLKLNIL